MIKNVSTVLLTSAVRTATPTVPILSASSALSDIHIIIDVTLDAASAIITPALQGFDVASSKWYDLVDAITTVAAVGTTVIRYGENTAVVANASNQGFMPSKIRLTLTHTDTDAITYSVGMNSVTK